MTKWVVTLDGKLIFQDDGTGNEDGKIYAYDDSLNPAAEAPTGIILPLPEAFGVSESGLFCGLAVSGDEQLIYTKRQRQPTFDIYNTSGTLVKTADMIPGVGQGSTGSTLQGQDSKIYITHDGLSIFSGYDNFKLVKHDLDGNYVAHKAIDSVGFKQIAGFAEDPLTGNIYVSSRYSGGIAVLDSSLNIINYIPLAKDALGIAIGNNQVYIALYNTGVNNIGVMDLDGANYHEIQIITGSNTSLSDVQVSPTGAKIYTIAYNGVMCSYDVATETTEFEQDVFSAYSSYPAALCIYAGHTSGQIYSTGLNMNQYIGIKIT